MLDLCQTYIRPLLYIWYARGGEMTLHSANTGQDEEDYGGFRNKGHHMSIHKWAKLNKSSYLLLKGEDSIVSQERLVLQPHIDGGADPVPLVLHGYEARVQDNPQVLDGPGFKMLRNALFSSHTLMVELILFLSSQWQWHRGTIAHWG